MFNDPSCVIVIQVGDGSKFYINKILDRFGIVDGEAYTFVGSPSWDKIPPLIIPSKRQLFLVSHRPPEVLAATFAKKIKELNPQALVFALTYSSIMNTELGSLDGILKRRTIRIEITTNFVRAFYQGKSLAELQQMLA